MQGVHTEEVGGWPCGGCRAFLLPKNGWRVVVQNCHCRFQPVRAETVADAIRVVGQKYKQLGSRDFRLDRFTGQLDFRLQRQLQSFEKQDPPPTRVKPTPLLLVQHVVQAAHTTTTSPSDASQATADLICIAFFFLLRPGEYTHTNNNNPFRLQDVQFHTGQRIVMPHQASPTDFDNVTAVALRFTNQKNGGKGEVIAHSCSGDILVCPCKAVIRRARYLLQHKQPPSAPLCRFFQNGITHHVSTIHIRNALHESLNAIGPTTLGIQRHEIDARSLRAGGATALLSAKVDKESIQLLGRWKSDAVMRYLHIAANPHTRQYAKHMISSGHATFNPGSNDQTTTKGDFSPPMEEFL
jgi:hypothetical protein